MKNFKLLYIFLATLAIMLSGCEKKYDDISKVTLFADIVIEGEKVVLVPINSSYTDAGAKAYDLGEEVEVRVSSNVDVTQTGGYEVVYSATNYEGFSNSVVRTVLVYNADAGLNTTDNIEGEYSANVIRNGDEAYEENTVTLTKVADGIYIISDWIGGFYSQGRGHGDAYNFKGYMQLTASNEVLHLSMSNPWGDPFDDVVDGVYNPATNELSWTANWLDGTYAFVVNMKLIEE